VLEADGYAAFSETGDVFDPELAARLKTIYSAGDTADPMDLYHAFRGRDANIAALLEQRGLTSPE
jgi:peptidyl-dipeptidase Dcp